MPKVEVECRYKTKLSDEDRAALETERIIKGDDAVDTEGKYGYTYAKLTFDLTDVKTFNDIDEDHSCIRFHGGESVVIKVSYLKFRSMYCMLTGQSITSGDDFRTSVE